MAQMTERAAPRDPRKQPKAGDVLCSNGRVRDVVFVRAPKRKGTVSYRFQFGWKTYTLSVKAWRRWSESARVLKYAD
jgi:hypothetical protein